MTPLAATSATSFAVGVDYERRFSPSVGAGIVADFTFGDHARSALIATGVTYRPTSALRLSAGPGIELVETDATGGGTKTKTYFLIGAGAAYEFHVGTVTLAPTVFIDFVGETKTNLTYGLGIGYGF